MPGLEVLSGRHAARGRGRLAAGGGGAAPPADLETLLRGEAGDDADLADIVGQARRQARARGRRGRRPQPAHGGAARLGQDHARAARARRSCRRSPAPRRSRSPASTASPACCRPSVPLVVRRPVPGAAPHHLVGRARGRRRHAAPRRGQPGSPRRAVPRRVPRVSALRSRGLCASRSKTARSPSAAGCTSLTFPARIMLVAAMNPCPCGFLRRHASASASARLTACASTRQRLSGPLLDRIDLRVDVPRVAAARPARHACPARRRRACARASVARPGAPARRAAPAPASTPTPTWRRASCAGSAWLEPDGIALLDRAYDTLRLSARACDRVVKVAQTIADLEGSETITAAAHRREPVVPRQGRRWSLTG